MSLRYKCYKLMKSNSSFFQKCSHSIVRGFEARDGNRVKKIERVQIHAEKRKRNRSSHYSI